MDKHLLTEQGLAAFAVHLKEEEWGCGRNLGPNEDMEGPRCIHMRIG